MAEGLVGLVGDIGGTNARFAIAFIRAGRITLENVLSLPGRNYPRLEDAATDYLSRVGQGRLQAAVVACAGPVVDGEVTFTNVAWTATERGLADAVGVRRARLLNDLAAVAWAAPSLESSSLRRIVSTGALPTPPAEAARATRAILNAGTGCNASAFVQNESGDAVVVGEFGHTSFAPTDALEVEIWRKLAASFGHVSNERVLAGPGLLNLYRALADIDGVPAALATPAEVSVAADRGDGQATRAVEKFCGLMGSIAGDIALTFGARGGVYLAGGVAVSVMNERFDTGFRARFEDKGRFRTYLADIPTMLIHDTNVALMGAARAMKALQTPP
jgi:glucokinase